eukprot:gnl/TRDRNA2_/TRDRNA2_181820_c0_seq1.p1 gnl/TRDRNA2_/TRDRNA2_181820_c0~~gnl/TRDRNA2_/TRDRNA2_181820_c0_seq1.p1  ORF type:complete len:195 (+),score=48.12 gnl/TRDRNA2_/TRDRNA2_181820_c0_seq1:62-586(+)
MAPVATLDDGAGRSELLRGIPDFKKAGHAKAIQGSHVNPIPATALQKGALPKNGHELARELRRRRSATEQVMWLADIPEDAFAAIFRVEIDAELLQSMLRAMRDASACSAEAKDGARRTLVALASKCPKALSFAASFAGAHERSVAEELLADLEADAAEASDLSAVRAALLSGP